MWRIAKAVPLWQKDPNEADKWDARNNWSAATSLGATAAPELTLGIGLLRGAKEAANLMR